MEQQTHSGSRRHDDGYRDDSGGSRWTTPSTTGRQ